MDQDANFPESAPTGDAALNLTERRAAFGARLRALREEHRLTSAALAQTTRININYIDALETGALEKLPGEVFGRGFVRCIAKNMGVDAQDLTREFDELWHKAPLKSVLKVEIKNKPMKERNETLQSLVANGRSLIKRGVAVKLGLPIGAGFLMIYLLVATPLVQFMTQKMHHGAASVARAPKTLNVHGDTISDADMPSASAEAEKSDDSVGDAAATAAAAAAADAKTMADASVSGVDSTKKAAAESAGAAEAAADASSDQPASPAKAAPAKAKQHDQDAGPKPAKDAAKEPADAPKSASDAATPPPAEAVETSPKSADSASQSGILELTVTEPVKIKLDVDKGPAVTKELKPDTYRFAFSDKADVMVYDAAAVKISFNGRPLGPLGSKGRVRKLSFRTTLPSAKNL